MDLNVSTATMGGKGLGMKMRGGPDATLDLFSDDLITDRVEPDGATFDGKAGFRDAAAGGFQRVAGASPGVHRSG